MPSSDTVRTVLQGETVESLGLMYGLVPKTILSHPANAELAKDGRTERVLHPGDDITIPALRERVESRPTEARHRAVRASRRWRLHVRFMLGDKPRANAAYAVTIDDAEPIQAHTDGDGFIDHEIPSSAQCARLHFADDPEEVIFTMWVGHLNPVTTTAGVQQRLRNLGYYWGEATGELDDDTAGAIGAFQSAKSLTVTRTADAATQAALLSAHGQ
jgi:hypothetical protein